MFGANCYIGLGYIFKVPVIAISTAPEFPWVSALTGNADNLAIVPNPYSSNVGTMHFWSRLNNLYTHYRDVYKFQKLTEEVQTAAMRKYLSPDIPNIREVEKSIALIFVNTDPILFGVKPLVPGLVQIGGIHVQANKDVLQKVHFFISILLLLFIKFNKST